ncbi:hypothetical protein SY83_08760 [Paenibacillus swuensis]|uniref:AB hydrolase-1 domain-containing protein n=1 Tax=Paenibacillus swuensis TaxID=1178515 RepID=A0A172TH29_9BACL|nr:alpha/beta hydrolase [Paenibacillus swuensis]ANE46355.1 hypothetical protein SY83_08760 [Paenibacillus swuensis]
MLALWILIIAIILLLFAACYAGWYFSGRVIHIEVRSFEQTWASELEAKRFDAEMYDKLVKKTVFLTSAHGYKMHGKLLAAVKESCKTVIIVHGVTMSSNASIKYSELFLKRGYNVLIYDHRRHGQSEGKTTTYGYYEKQDLGLWVQWLREHYGAGCEIGIMGESMGAATALQYAALDTDIAFYVIDCPYSDLREQLVYRLREDFKLPAFPLLNIANFFVWLRSGFTFGQVSPIREIAAADAPMLFITGADDRFIPPRMTQELYDAKPGFKRLYMAPGADHAMAYVTDRKAYDEVVGAFLEELSTQQHFVHADMPLHKETRREQSS